MPTYQYKCRECSYDVEENISINDRDKPLETPCPLCGKTTIERIFGSPIINLGFRGSTIQSKAPSEFKEHLQKIKAGVGAKRAAGIEL